MRAQQTRNESGDERQKRVQRGIPGGPVGQPLPLGGGVTADSVRHLQRLAGNAAVSRAVGDQRHPPVTGPSAVVQRMDEDGLHRSPPGPSLRVRGDRPSSKRGRTENVLTAAEWQSLPQATRNSSHKQRLSIDKDPNTLQETDRLLHYNLGGLNRLAPNAPWEGGRNAVLEALGRADPQTAGYWDAQDARDRKLGEDARAVRDGYTETAQDRQQRHNAVDQALAGSQDAMGDLQALLRDYDGVAIGGAHSGAAIWQFLATNMAQIKAAGVSTVYLESIREDAYQAAVDQYVGGGTMSDDLRAFVTRYDSGMNLGANGLGALLDAARANGMRVKGLDGRPARRPPMSADALFQRAAAMNTYAAQVVTRDRARRPSAAGGYLMELGSAHTGMHAGPSADTSVHGADFRQDEGFPGVDDLLGIPAVGYEQDRFRRLQNP